VTCSSHEGDAEQIHHFVGKHEGKTPLGKPKSRLEDRIKIYLINIGSEGVDCIKLAQDWFQWRAFLKMVTRQRIA
jgi:hypothetical protein